MRNPLVRLFLSKAILSEYPEIVALHPTLDIDSTESLLRRLRYVSEYFKLTRQKARFDRDPRDEKFLELAILANATHIISHDLDLLSLTFARTDAAKEFRRRLPNIQILKAADFMQIWIKRN